MTWPALRDGSPVLPELLGQFREGEEAATVSARCHGLRANRCRVTDGGFETLAVLRVISVTPTLPETRNPAHALIRPKW